jgi:SH3-like domain-containing protein
MRLRIIVAAATCLVVVLVAGSALAKTWYIQDCDFSMRRAPQRFAPRVWALRSGQPVSIVSRQGLWVKVKTRGGRTGWIPVAWLRRVKPASPIDPALRRTVLRLDKKIRRLQAQNAQLRANAGNTDFLLRTLRKQQRLIDLLRAEILALKKNQ